MDSGVMDLVDEIEALRAEIKRIRSAISGVFAASEDQSFSKALRKLQIEVERFSPSMGIDARRRK